MKTITTIFEIFAVILIALIISISIFRMIVKPCGADRSPMDIKSPYYDERFQLCSDEQFETNDTCKCVDMFLHPKNY